MFGDYLYGTEILKLPMPEDDFIILSPSHLQCTNTLVNKKTERLQIEFDPVIAYWFRWVTGHQVMFVLWHLLTKELAYMKKTGLDNIKLDHCLQILQGGALIFEYTGSCSLGYYHKYIRPFMSLAHKAFSGRWALDYKRLPQLIKQITQENYPNLTNYQQQTFKKAYQAHQKSHYGVAKRLVPEDNSLLKNAKNTGITLEEVQPHHYMMYDQFFLVHRTTVSCEEFEHSLWQRINAIQMDLSSYPLPKLPFVPDNHVDILQQTADAVSSILQMIPSQNTKL